MHITTHTGVGIVSITAIVGVVLAISIIITGLRTASGFQAASGPPSRSSEDVEPLEGGHVVEEGVPEGLCQRYPLGGLVGQHLLDEVEQLPVVLHVHHPVGLWRKDEIRLIRAGFKCMNTCEGEGGLITGFGSPKCPTVRPRRRRTECKRNNKLHLKSVPVVE